eukprot:scaffold201_cov405-Prasinococcus_capsulatus_cf.AAC.30
MALRPGIDSASLAAQKRAWRIEFSYLGHCCPIARVHRAHGLPQAASRSSVGKPIGEVGVEEVIPGLPWIGGTCRDREYAT